MHHLPLSVLHSFALLSRFGPTSLRLRQTTIARAHMQREVAALDTFFTRLLHPFLGDRYCALSRRIILAQCCLCHMFVTAS